MKIALAADHAGFELKNFLAEFLTGGADGADKHEVIDLGAHEFVRTDNYPDLGVKIAEAVQRGECDKAIAICGSGVGMSVVINKFRGVYASVCHDAYSAAQSVEHDQVNVLCIGARVIGTEVAKKIVTEFIAAKFIDAPNFSARVAQIKQIEAENFKPE